MLIAHRVRCFLSPLFAMAHQKQRRPAILGQPCLAQGTAFPRGYGVQQGNLTLRRYGSVTSTALEDDEYCTAYQGCQQYQHTKKDCRGRSMTVVATFPAIGWSRSFTALYLKKAMRFCDNHALVATLLGVSRVIVTSKVERTGYE